MPNRPGSNSPKAGKFQRPKPVTAHQDWRHVRFPRPEELPDPSEELYWDLNDGPDCGRFYRDAKLTAGTRYRLMIEEDADGADAE